MPRSVLSRLSSGEIEFRLRPHQLEVLDNMRRFNVLVAHRRFGKTVAALAILILKALECTLKRPQVHYFAPTYQQAKRVAWSYLKEFCSELPGSVFNEAELKVTLINGATIQLGSADNPDSSRGIYSDFVVLDEPAQMPPDMWFKVLRPALSDRKGGALFIGTPAGRHGLLYDAYNAAESDPEWFSAMFRASDTNIIDPSELESARRSMSPAEFAQEFELSWDASIRGAYWSDAMNRAEIGDFPAEAGEITHIAMDLGINDATACWFFHLQGNRPVFHSYAEYTNMGLPDIVADWHMRRLNYGKVIVPHDIAVRELGSGKTRQEVMHNLGVSTIVAPKMSVIEGIEMVRNLLPRAKFNRTCADGIEALRQYRADYEEKKGVLALRPLHDWTSHAADAMRYMATTGLASLQSSWDTSPDYSKMDKALCA